MARVASRHGSPPAGKPPQFTTTPLAADRHLHRQRAGVGVAVEPGRRRRAAIDDHRGAAGLQAMEAALGQRDRQLAAAPRPRQHMVDQRAGLLLGAVELGEAEIAVAEEAQHRGHALDRGGERGGRLRLGGLQQGADVDQVLQRRQVRQRAALGVAAVGQHLAGELLRQEAQHAVEVGRLVRQRHRHRGQALQRGQRAAVHLLGGQRGGQAARIGDQPRHQLLAERVVGGGGEEVVMAEPGGDARADHVRAMRDRVQRRRGDPLADQGAGAQQRGRGADLAQVAQPGEAVRRGGEDAARPPRWPSCPAATARRRRPTPSRRAAAARRAPRRRARHRASAGSARPARATCWGAAARAISRRRSRSQVRGAAARHAAFPAGSAGAAVGGGLSPRGCGDCGGLRRVWCGDCGGLAPRAMRRLPRHSRRRRTPRCRRSACRRRPATASRAVSGPMPPSTASAIGWSAASIIRRSAAILASCEGRNDCPPNPGLTVITSTMSASSSSQATASTGVPGFSTTPARLPSARMSCSERCGCGPASGCRQDVVGAGLGEGGEVGIDRADHQVHVERQAGVRAQRLQHQRAEAEVGDEMAVHDVEVQPVGAGGLDRLRPRRAGGRSRRPAGWGRWSGGGPGAGAMGGVLETGRPGRGRRAGGVWRESAARRGRSFSPMGRGTGRPAADPALGRHPTTNKSTALCGRLVRLPSGTVPSGSSCGWLSRQARQPARKQVFFAQRKQGGRRAHGEDKFWRFARCLTTLLREAPEYLLLRVLVVLPASSVLKTLTLLLDCLIAAGSYHEASNVPAACPRRGSKQQLLGVALGAARRGSPAGRTHLVRCGGSGAVAACIRAGGPHFNQEQRSTASTEQL